MVSLSALWLPILLAALLVWVASFVVWAVLPHHRSDYAAFSDEEAVRRAMGGIPPGQYNIPHVPSRAALADPEFRRRFEEGPVGFFTAMPAGVPSTRRNLALYAVYCLAVTVLVGYLTGRALPPGAAYLEVFRIAAVAAWLGFGWAVVSDAVWFGRPWKAVGKHLADSLLYGLLVGGAFGSLWPA